MKKHRWITAALILIFIIGLSVLLYPTVSDYLNSLSQSRVISQYTADLAQIDNENYAAVLEAARAYNLRLWSKDNRYFLSGEEYEEYNALLNIGGNGVMGYLEISSISVRLPIYHGTGEAVLQAGIGHVEGTSLPVGGSGTHAAISGHRGLPSALLLTNLDKLIVGDSFILTILDETLTYEVDRILIVEPHDMSALVIEQDKDYVTLVTCTPYGINSHRLLVRGVRVDNAADSSARTVRVSADARVIDSEVVMPFLAAPILLVLLVYLLIKYRKRPERS